jgi:glycosyltransferase involved in cell wall biosynthesis
LVSVIIPYYNKVDTIDRSVDSVINQLYTDWELIIVDDCSVKPIDKPMAWNDYNIKILYNEVNLGPGPTRQRGMDVALGDYLVFLDADDWWDPRFLKVSLENLLDVESLNVGSTWAMTSVIKNGMTSLKNHNDKDHDRIAETLIQYGHPWSTSSLLWRKSVVGSWGDLSTNQDSWFEYSSALNNNRIKKINEVLVFKDEGRGNHRIDLVKMSEINRNRFMLYQRILIDNWRNFSFKYRFICINRLAWVIQKNQCRITYSELRSSNLNPILNIIFHCFSSYCLLTKITHRLFQFTIFRIY